MGKRYRDDTTGPLSPLNDTIAIPFVGHRPCVEEDPLR